MIRGKMVSDDAVEGATITSFSTYGDIEVVTEDGRTLVIRVEVGYSGTELNVYDVTRKARTTK